MKDTTSSFFIFFCFRTGFRPTKGGRLIRLMRRGMCTGQALFPLEIEPGIPQVRPWNELLATGAQATWLYLHEFNTHFSCGNLLLYESTISISAGLYWTVSPF